MDSADGEPGRARSGVGSRLRTARGARGPRGTRDVQLVRVRGHQCRAGAPASLLMSEIEIDRERVIQTLCLHFANDNLSTQELELRLGYADKAGTSAELGALVAGLPALDRKW